MKGELEVVVELCAAVALLWLVHFCADQIERTQGGKTRA